MSAAVINTCTSASAAIAHVVDERRLLAQVIVVAVRLRAIEKHANARILALRRILGNVDGRDESGEEEERGRTTQWSQYGDAARSVYCPERRRIAEV